MKRNSGKPYIWAFLGRVNRQQDGFFRFVVAVMLFLLPAALPGQVRSELPGGENMNGQEVMLVWSAEHGRGEQVYFSRYDRGSWSPPVQLSDDVALVFQPVVGSGSDGKVWAVWSRQDTDGSHLHYCVGNSGKWEKPRHLDTGMSSNTSAAVVVDRNNTPWLTWTGIDDTYPDIFWSRWNGKGWSAPVKAHEENNVPDLHPSLVLDEAGNVLLSWQTYAKGKYVSVTRSWDGHQWQTASSEAVTNMRLKSSNFVRREIAPVPAFIADSRKATMHIKYNGSASSILLSQL